MPYIPTFDRNQMMMCSWDSFVDPESIARLIDAFVDSLDLTEYGVKEAAKEGRPSYPPKGMYKLHIYGNRKGMHSSRKLEEGCKVNIEVKWLMGGLEPDFRTISDFRKENIDSMKKIFHEFNRRISGAVEWGFSSVDGSKFQANNSKDRNFTKNKLDDRIKWLDMHTEDYLRILDEMDKQEEEEERGETLEHPAKGLQEEAEEPVETPEHLTKESTEAKLKEARERLARYKGYQELMEKTGISQLSLTDADARLMKNKNGFTVSYNPQTVVDSKTHLIRDFLMSNQVTDHGLLNPTMNGIKEETPKKIVEVVADKGYESSEDMIKCLENGIIPHVITDDGKDGYELEIPYEEAEADTSSIEPEELKKSLHAGKIPRAYKEVIEKIEVVEVRRQVKEETTEVPKSIYGTPEEMLERAKEGHFVRDPERNLVYCPAGEILRQKSIKKNGNIRYANKTGCKNCKNRNRCYKGKNEWKEIDFTKDKLEKPCKDWKSAEDKSGKKEEEKTNTEPKKKVKYEKVKIVKFFLKPNREKMAQRMCLSEHPFGTIKRAMGATYFLLKGLRNVAGEFALFCLGYNMERAKNLLGFEKMMKLMTGAKTFFFQNVCFIQFSMTQKEKGLFLCVKK